MVTTVFSESGIEIAIVDEWEEAYQCEAYARVNGRVVQAFWTVGGFPVIATREVLERAVRLAVQAHRDRMWDFRCGEYL